MAKQQVISDSESVRLSITRPKDGTKSNVQSVVTYYDAKGAASLSLDSDKVCAVSTVGGNNLSFKVKVHRGGKLYNPLKEGRDYGLNKKDKTTNENAFKLRSVNDQCFNTYVRFLKNRADSLLTIAEREL